MLEEFRNKKVKILVGSNSGVALGGGPTIDTSIIRMMGVITDYNDEFIKLSNMQMISASMAEITSGFTGGGLKHIVESSSVSLVNRRNILTIFLVEE